jgi:hypothetical protein
LFNIGLTTKYLARSDRDDSQLPYVEGGGGGRRRRRSKSTIRSSQERAENEDEDEEMELGVEADMVRCIYRKVLYI